VGCSWGLVAVVGSSMVVHWWFVVGCSSLVVAVWFVVGGCLLVFVWFVMGVGLFCGLIVTLVLGFVLCALVFYLCCVWFVRMVVVHLWLLCGVGVVCLCWGLLLGLVVCVGVCWLLFVGCMC
jgi:hypothetical protein